MRIEMTNKRFTGAANVLPDDVEQWEAQGWVKVPETEAPKKSPKKGKSK